MGSGGLGLRSGKHTRSQDGERQSGAIWTREWGSHHPGPPGSGPRPRVPGPPTGGGGGGSDPQRCLSF